MSNESFFIKRERFDVSLVGGPTKPFGFFLIFFFHSEIQFGLKRSNQIFPCGSFNYVVLQSWFPFDRNNDFVFLDQESGLNSLGSVHYRQILSQARRVGTRWVLSGNFLFKTTKSPFGRIRFSPSWFSGLSYWNSLFCESPFIDNGTLAKRQIGLGVGPKDDYKGDWNAD